MEKLTKFVINLAFLLMLDVKHIDSSSESVAKIHASFIKHLDECGKELNLNNHIISDINNFWREKYDLINRDTGCAIICLGQKHGMFTSDHKLKHEDGKSFAKMHGADDVVAEKLVNLVHECEKKFSDIKDDCTRVLEIAKCFRTGIDELNWTPNVEFIVEEVLSEI